MNLGILWDGAYCSENPINKADEKDDTIFEYSEQDYIKYRVEKEVQVVPAFNKLYIQNENGLNQLYRKVSDNNYVPVNYSDLRQGGDAWHQDYGLKLATGEDGKPALYWQRPYGATSSEKGLIGGKLYDNGEGYYKYRRNPEHKCYFEYNDTEEYFNDLSNWTKVYELSDLVVKKVAYTSNPNGEYLKDPVDELYHPYSYYTFYKLNDDGSYTEDAQGTYIEYELDDDDNMTYIEATERFDCTVEYIPFSVEDKLVIEDFMKEIFSNWYYCIDTLSHIKPVTDVEGNLIYPNYNKIVDCSQTYSDELGDNGNGLFILDSLLNYYASSVTVGLCDNFCKNMMMHSYDDGKTWSPAWYDMDTCFGLNNTGFYVFDYDVDFKDPGVFNGSNSTLWTGLYYTFMDKIKKMYKELRDTNKLSYENSMKVIYDGNIKYKSEAMYNSSAFDRYILPKLNNQSGTVLAAAQGNRLSLLEYWLSNREVFLDSNYGSGKYSNDVANMRFYAPQSFNLNLVPNTTMYLGFAFNQAEADMPAPESRSPKVKAGDTWSYNVKVTEPLVDLNTKIFGASHLLDFGDLGTSVPKYVDIKAAPMLKRLILGTDDPVALERHEEITKTQGLIIELPLQVSPNMTEMDLHNLKYIGFNDKANTGLSLVRGSVNLFPALEKLDMRGSNITSVAIGAFTPLKYIGYSDFTTSINLNNLPNLERIELGDISLVSNLSVINSGNINQFNILKLFVDKAIKISLDNLIIPEEEAVSTDFMNWLYDKNADITGGDIYVRGFNETQLQKYREKWNRLKITLKRVIPTEVIYGITGEGGLDE